MIDNRDPILAQFAVPPRAIGECRCLDCDPATGLLYEQGAATPLVEELIALGGAWQSDGRIVTLLTETRDPPDPDLVRGESLRQRVEAAVTTFFTKTDGDPIDPDLVRTEAAGRTLERVETLLTRVYPDPPDPDEVRTASVWRDGGDIF